MTDQAMRTAAELVRQAMEKDVRKLALIDAVLLQIIDNLGPTDNLTRRQIAHSAAERMHTMIYQSDAELSALRLERDVYKEAYGALLKTMPLSMIADREPILVPS